VIETDLAIFEEAHIPVQDVHDRKTDGVIPDHAIVEISEYLTGRKEIYEAICKKFEGIYSSRDLLEQRVDEEGVPLDDHTIWDDAIEWGNAVSNLDRIIRKTHAGDFKR
jgi:hypothetical protein